MKSMSSSRIVNVEIIVKFFFQGKSEAIRIRSILRSLVPLEDLLGVISLSFELPRLERGI